MAERSTVFQARLTADEAAAMDRRRAELGGGGEALSRSDYLRLLLAADAARQPDERPQAAAVNPLFYRNVVTQLRRLGTNLNQAVRVANALEARGGGEYTSRAYARFGLDAAAAEARDGLAAIAEDCAAMHELAGIPCSHSYARALMRQAHEASPVDEAAEGGEG